MNARDRAEQRRQREADDDRAYAQRYEQLAAMCRHQPLVSDAYAGIAASLRLRADQLHPQTAPPARATSRGSRAPQERAHAGGAPHHTDPTGATS